MAAVFSREFGGASIALGRWLSIERRGTNGSDPVHPAIPAWRKRARPTVVGASADLERAVCESTAAVCPGRAAAQLFPGSISRVARRGLPSEALGARVVPKAAWICGTGAADARPRDGGGSGDSLLHGLAGSHWVAPVEVNLHAHSARRIAALTVSSIHLWTIGIAAAGVSAGLSAHRTPLVSDGDNATGLDGASTCVSSRRLLTRQIVGAQLVGRRTPIVAVTQGRGATSPENRWRGRPVRRRTTGIARCQRRFCRPGERTRLPWRRCDCRW